MPITVLSNETQYRVFAADPTLDSAQVFCDEPAFADFLSARNVRFTALDDFTVADRWEEINRWGSERALRWAALCRERGFFTDTDLPSVTYLFFSYMLAQALKNRFFAEVALMSDGADSVLAFEPKAPRYPGFSGNAFLNYALIALARRQGLPVRVAAGAAREMSERPDVHAERTAGRSPGLRARAQRFYARLIHPKHASLIASGGLRHVAALLDEAKRQGLDAAIYDGEFHVDQFLFAVSRKLPYYVPECFSEGPSTATKSDMPAAIAAAREEKLFQHGEDNWSGLVEELILAPLAAYEAELRAKLRHYRAVARETAAKALVVDEDFALKGAPLAAAFRFEGARVFCPSHANLTVDFEVVADDRVFGESVTFTQSEYERDMYAKRGWDPSKIETTGLPRYDRLLRAAPRPKRPRTPKRLLFCPGVLWPYSADNHAYAGCHFECYRDVQEPVFAATLRAASGLPVSLVIKPHHAGLGESYRAFVEREKNRLPAGGKVRVEFLSHKKDLLELMLECDALVVTYWSTAIVEAALIGLPVIFVHFRSIVSPALEEFAAHGFCRVVRDEASLRDALAAVCEGRAALPRRREDYFLGPREGRGAERAVARIRMAIAGGTTAPEPAETALR